MRLKDIFFIESSGYHFNFHLKKNNITEFNSALYFTGKRELAFNDDLFFTRWKTENNTFNSQTSFLTRPSESISANLTNLINNSQELGEFLNDLFITTEGDFLSPYHRNNHLEIYYIVEGEFKIKVQKNNITLHSGEGLILDQNTLHSDYIRQESSKIIIIGISKRMLDETVIGDIDEVDLLKFLKLALVKEKTKSEYIKFKPKNNKEKINSILLKLFQEINEKDFGYTFVIQGLISRLLNTITLECDYYLIKSNQKLHKQLLFNEIEKYIELNFRDIKLKDLVNKFNYTEDYFNRIIKEMTGFTYTQYVQEIRLTNAANLLITTSLPVSKIALEVGYNNIQFFYQIFSSKYKMTPKKYRMKMSKKF